MSNGNDGERGKVGETGKTGKMGIVMGRAPPKTPPSPFSPNEDMGRDGGTFSNWGWGWGWGDLYPSPFPKCSSLIVSAYLLN
jgi:hypothetical protein